MLATAYWETSHIEFGDITSKNRKGKLVTRTQGHWVNMKPAEETGHGAGRDYFLPVKVKLLDSGDALITEQDGDQFLVHANGKISPTTKKAKLGSQADGVARKVYQENDGTELTYFGRGYVQLTWWSNYAQAGIDLGKGLEFLLNPNNVMDPGTAYDIMSISMRMGNGFANKHKFSDYFFGSCCDYLAARSMVNPGDCSAKIAEIARLFETVLYDARELR